MFLQLALDTQFKDEVHILLVLEEGVQLQDGRVTEARVYGHLLPHPVDQSPGGNLTFVDLGKRELFYLFTQNNI